MVLLKKRSRLLPILFLGLLASGCSGDDLAEEKDYFSAVIEGEKLVVDEFSGLMEGEKRISVLGTVDLFVKMESGEGRTIEFLILNYNGKKRYSIGEGDYYDSWIKYSQINPLGSWNVNKTIGNLPLHPNTIEITDDTGKIISGIFSFQGRDSASGTIKAVTEGKFNFQY